MWSTSSDLTAIKEVFSGIRYFLNDNKIKTSHRQHLRFKDNTYHDELNGTNVVIYVCHFSKELLQTIPSNRYVNSFLAEYVDKITDRQ